MQGIDIKRRFISVNIALLTVSDSRVLENDKSGQYLKKSIVDAGHNCASRLIERDEKNLIIKVLKNWILNKNIDVIITTGGTGITGRDVTPEAFKEVGEKEICGFGELFRMLSYESIGASTIQSRALAFVSNGTYMFALPGSPGACKDAWEKILKSQLDNRTRPCNLVELIDRLKEK